MGGAEANGGSSGVAVSADGQLVAFASDATNLVEGDSNRSTDIFVYDRRTGPTSRVSVRSDGAQANGGSFRAEFVGPRQLLFSSNADNLVPGDRNRRFDYFLRDLDTGRTGFAQVGPRGPRKESSTPLSFSADGGWVGFASERATLVGGDTNRRSDAFAFGPLSDPWTLPPPGAGSARAASARQRPAAPYDFDGDDRQDLTIGLPRYQPRGTPDAGGVVVLRGTRHGPSARERFLTRDSPDPLLPGSRSEVSPVLRD